MIQDVVFGFENTPNGVTIFDFIHDRRDNLSNLKGADDTKFRFSQVVDSIFHYHLNMKNVLQGSGIDIVNINNYSGNYIFSTCVAYHPLDWTDMQSSKSVFEYVPENVIKDLQQGRAMFLIDQSVEGYSANWLWEWFHKKCIQYKINPSCIIYFTGDQSCTDRYQEWCRNSNVVPALNIFPSISLGTYVRQHYERNNLDIKFSDVLEYKRNNKDNLYLYDCTNKRPRMQRMINFLHLFKSGLLDYGNISMPSKSSWGSMGTLHADLLKQYNLPEDIVLKLEDKEYFADHQHDNNVEHYWVFVERILHEMYKNSWVSIVTESSYFESEYSVFISEKTFKPLASLQPFVVSGSRNTLKYLKKLGFKTFHPYIDETYDQYQDGDRFVKLTETLNKIKNIEDKVSWYESMKDILEHNQRLFLEITYSETMEFKKIKECYFRYFNKDV